MSHFLTIKKISLLHFLKIFMPVSAYGWLDLVVFDLLGIFFGQIPEICQILKLAPEGVLRQVTPVITCEVEFLDVDVVSLICSS